ncbi:MAG: hypothetical protein KDJ54_02010 [Candidatus Competibacteraceae bacterium]|nr:hypothetical protein [Candidatus Competibacteraceae bacterium]
MLIPIRVVVFPWSRRLHGATIRVTRHEARVFPLVNQPERKSRDRIHVAGSGSFSTVWRRRLHDCPNLGDEFKGKDYTAPSIPHE